MYGKYFSCVTCSHDVAEIAGLTTFSFGEEEVDRYVMLFKKVKTIYLCKEVKQVALGVVSLAKVKISNWLEAVFLVPGCLIQFSFAFSTQHNRHGFC